jgi:hypothetical protein
MSFDNEAEMLKRWTSLVLETDPDIITGQQAFLVGVRCWHQHLHDQLFFATLPFTLAPCVCWTCCGSMVQQWYSSGTAVVQQWYSSGTAVVQQWYSSGTAVVQQWYSSGWLTVALIAVRQLVQRQPP